jgi:hypothetical protein
LLGLLGVSALGTARKTEPQTEVRAEEMLFVHRAMATPAGIKLRYTGRLTSARAIRNGNAKLRGGVEVNDRPTQRFERAIYCFDLREI